MNEQNQININDVLALLGVKELEISLLRKQIVLLQESIKKLKENPSVNQPLT